MTPRSAFRTVARWTLRLAGSAVVLLLVAATTIYALSSRDMAATFEVPTHTLAVPTDSATVAHGKRLASVKGCVECHGAGLVGNVMLDDPAVGRLAAPNLTNGGRGKELTNEDWERALRHGVKRDGTSLFVMPANEFYTMSDEDIAAIVAYARSLPAVSGTPGDSRAGPVLRTMQVLNQLDVRPAADIPHDYAHPARVTPDTTAEYGEYIAIGCTGCHGKGFSGGKIPGTPPDWKPAANITPTGIGHYSEADFMRLLRTGMRPSGVQVDPKMDWRLTSQMTDTEIIALYRYLKTVPPKPYGQR